MDVTVEAVEMKAWRDPSRTVHPRLWRVRVDGVHAGFIGRDGDTIKEGAKLMMHLRFPEDELVEIEQKVAGHFGQAIEAKQPPEMPDMSETSNDDLMEDFE